MCIRFTAHHQHRYWLILSFPTFSIDEKVGKKSRPVEHSSNRADYGFDQGHFTQFDFGAIAMD